MAELFESCEAPNFWYENPDCVFAIDDGLVQKAVVTTDGADITTAEEIESLYTEPHGRNWISDLSFENCETFAPDYVLGDYSDAFIDAFNYDTRHNCVQEHEPISFECVEDGGCQLRSLASCKLRPVSYTHLTLPTKA